MKATRHEIHKRMLETVEASEGRGVEEYIEFEVWAAQEHARHKTSEVQQHAGHVRHETMFGSRHVKHKARKAKGT